MSIFGQMEADWRDQQSGAREQKYDEEPDELFDLQSNDHPTTVETSEGQKLPSSPALKVDRNRKVRGN